MTALARALALSLAVAAGAAPARSAPVGPAPARSAPDTPPVACGTQAAEYSGGAKGFRLWVTRRGAMTWTNPLRPLSPESLQVLQVVIRGKAATAYGPDLSRLQRGGPPAALEALNGTAIRWTDAADGLPPVLRIVDDEGAKVLAELAFQACGDAPKVAEAKPAQKPRTAKAKPRPSPDPPADATRTPSGLTLPQGAIP
ncbi:hypothetical protein OPKNFCMD_5364 [Methylobacterium crusticola]|uniref:Uncharacterized protein n=1 Tax=Methylobacterium crusticola TaxID=1697972 RepID=A0ABQ4R4H3_9HYPH|nr:hypothetical protein [Methylobacterium crusticola]GJD52598.1 hypothetical protein OPKNFCMD_5364 [Methylobacterium crusticola]